jgi:iron(III) transport system substrate-binding protein
LLKASAVSPAGARFFAEPLMAAAPPPTAVTSALVDAAQKEGKVSFHTALELNTAERLSRMFEAKYPGIAVRVERSGAERIFQRIAQEQGSGINAVDVANSAPTPHTISFKTKGRKQAGPSSKSWSSTPRFDCPVFGTCVYRKIKAARSDGEVRLRWRANL